MSESSEGETPLDMDTTPPIFDPGKGEKRKYNHDDLVAEISNLSEEQIQEITGCAKKAHKDNEANKNTANIPSNKNPTKKQAVQEEPITKYNFEKCRMGEVNEQMEVYIENAKNAEINVEAVSNFNSKLMNCIAENTPKVKTKNFTHDLPPFIIRLIKSKRKMYRDYQRNPIPDSKRQINDYNKSIHKLIDHYSF
ncbi:hypothetical protein JTB14_021304 [Gonioctena quinquepunctata]|nr:hypothetical protein JTB14_021304 [Gonioctena quinquepunctata]